LPNQKHSISTEEDVNRKSSYIIKKANNSKSETITISLRKCSNLQDVTASNLLDTNYIIGLEHRNEGYKILRNIRSSPAYWEARKIELFATIHYSSLEIWQLLPIGNSAIFSPLDKGITSLAGLSLWEKFHFYELEEIMRQQGDPAFANALNRMKVGVITEDDILLLKSREITAFNKPPENIVWLFHFRKKVHEHNEAALAKSKDPGIVSNAVDQIEGKGDLDDIGQKKLLSEAAALDYQKARGLPFQIILKKSIRYMITMNIPNTD